MTSGRGAPFAAASLLGGVALVVCGAGVTLADVREEVDGTSHQRTEQRARRDVRGTTGHGSLASGDPRHGKRAFAVPPGHRERPARNVAPGAAHSRRSSNGPVGAVLGATPPSNAVGDVPQARNARGSRRPDAVVSRPSGLSALGGALGAARPATFGGAEQGAALAAVLGGTPSARRQSAAGLPEPAHSSGLGDALVALIVALQVCAALVCVPLFRRVLGGFGMARLL